MQFHMLLQRVSPEFFKYRICNVYGVTHSNTPIMLLYVQSRTIPDDHILGTRLNSYRGLIPTKVAPGVVLLLYTYFSGSSQQSTTRASFARP